MAILVTNTASYLTPSLLFLSFFKYGLDVWESASQKYLNWINSLCKWAYRYGYTTKADLLTFFPWFAATKMDKNSKKMGTWIQDLSDKDWKIQNLWLYTSCLIVSFHVFFSHLIIDFKVFIIQDFNCKDSCLLSQSFFNLSIGICHLIAGRSL